MRLGLSQSLEQNQVQEMELQLESPDKRRLLRLINLWDSKDPNEFSVKLADIRSIFGAKDGKDDSEQLLKIDFMLLSPEEMKRAAAEGEAVGGFTGDITYVSSETPKEYVPFVMMNLAMLKLVDKDSELIDSLGLRRVTANVDMQRHWTANMFDIMVAEHHYGPDSEEFKEYLEWRQYVERTDFFRDTRWSEFIEAKNSVRQYRRMTHPLNRKNTRAARSWNLASTLYGYSELDTLARGMGTSRVDWNLFRLFKFEKNFDPEQMIRLIDRFESERGRTIDLRNDPQLDNQAYLLTEDVQGDCFACLKVIDEQGVYEVEKSVGQTFEAMKNKLAYFMGKGMRKLCSQMGEESGTYSKLLNEICGSLNSGKKLSLEEIGAFDISNEEEREKIFDKLVAINNKRAEIYLAITKLDLLADNEDFLPQALEVQKEKLLKLDRELAQAEETLGGMLTIMDDISDIEESASSILKSVPNSLISPQLSLPH